MAKSREARADGTHARGRSTASGARGLAESYVDPAAPESDAGRHELEAAFWREAFDQLVADIPDSVLVVVDGGDITHWNEAHTEMSGIAEAEALGRYAHDLLGTEGIDETLAEEVARRNTTVSEDSIREIDRIDKTLQVYAVPLRDPDGEAVGAFSVAADVTGHVDRRQRLESLQGRVGDEVLEQADDLEVAVSNMSEFTDEADSFER